MIRPALFWVLIIAWISACGTIFVSRAQHPSSTVLLIDHYSYSVSQNKVFWRVRIGELDERGNFQDRIKGEDCSLSLATSELQCGSRGSVARVWAEHLEDDIRGFLEHLYQMSSDVRNRDRAEEQQ